MPEEVYKEQGNIVIFKCNTSMCPNNPDSKAKFDWNGEFINEVGNIDRQFLPFSPRRIV